MLSRIVTERVCQGSSILSRRGSVRGCYGLKQEDEPLPTPVIERLIGWPDLHQLRPVAIDLRFAGLARLVDAAHRPDLHPRNRVGAKIQGPGVGAFKARVDIAHHEPFTIAQVEDGGRTLPTSAAPCGRQQQELTKGSPCRNPPTPSALIHPAVKR